MGVAKYIKDEKDAIKEVIYQSGIKIKPVYTPKDLEEVGFEYGNDLGDPGNILSPAACIPRATVHGPGPHGSTPVLVRRRRPMNALN